MALSMCRSHPRWTEFLDRLAGPEGCDFKEDGSWRCAGGYDKTYATAIMRDMGLSETEIAYSLVDFEDHGGHCDCEILFNVAEA